MVGKWARIGLAAWAVLTGVLWLVPGLVQGQPRAALDDAVWVGKVHAAWLGKVAAGSGALPTEGMSREQIRARFGVLTGPPRPPTPRGPLDDTTLAILGWHAVQEHGAAFTTADVAQTWVDHLTDPDLKGGGYGRETLDCLTRLRQGDRPPIRTGSLNMEGIAGQMRAEIWGLLAPGNPSLAADFAARDASVYNSGNGIHAAQFTAALTSQLMADPDITKAIGIARDQIPATSALHKLVGDVLAWYQTNPNDWGPTWDLFTERCRDRSLEGRMTAWSSDWLVETSGWPQADVLADYLGAQSVLRTHPFSPTEPAALTTQVAVPASGGRLKLHVTCNDMPANVDWLLRVRTGDTVEEHPIAWVAAKQTWQDFGIDLKPWAGQTVTIVLENAVQGKFAWEAGFWTAPEMHDGEGAVLHGQRPANRPYRYPLEFTPTVLPETFSVLVGLLYGQGDFRQSVNIATMCGFDTDCNAGTVGGLLGLRNGLQGIPGEWKDPLQDHYSLQVTGLPREWSIADLARRIVDTGESLLRGAKQPAPATGGGAAVPPPTPAPAGNGAASLPTHAPEGFGALARGGEGGRVITVTTLADSGPGSLREALAAQGPRIVAFAVAGTIELQSRLRCTSGQITVDGGTAPGEGITLLNHGIQFRGDCDDIIVRNLRIRVLTGGDQGDCLLLWGNQGGTVERVLVDHCSFMWATDEVINTWGEVRDVTFQWCLFAEAQLPHSKGWLSGVGSDRVSIHHCLFAQNADRNPKLQGGTHDFVNNVVYNWGANNAAKIDAGARVNLVNNCFVPGPDSWPKSGCVFPQDTDQGTQVYLSGNVAPYTPEATGDQWANVTWYEQVGGKSVERRPAPVAFRATKPFPAAAIRTESALEAYESVLAGAGAKVRDADDLRVLREVRERTGSVGK